MLFHEDDIVGFLIGHNRFNLQTSAEARMVPGTTVQAYRVWTSYLMHVLQLPTETPYLPQFHSDIKCQKRMSNYFFIFIEPRVLTIFD